MTGNELRAEWERIYGKSPGCNWSAKDFREALIINIKILFDRERGQ